MSDLHNTVDRKFLESFDVSEWEILTDTGFADITHSHKTIEYVVWEIVTESGKILKCADDHIIFDENIQEIFAKDLIPLGSYVATIDGLELVLSVSCLGYSESMYDLTVESPNHRYYTNGILSHNTTTAAAIILHYILFNKHKLVGLLANKGDSSREILDRIKLAYEALPDWLQSGVVTWNKGSIELENGCKVIAASTTSSSIRGKSVSLLYIDETAFVENWSEFMSAVFPTIASGETTKILLTSTPNGLNHYYQICEGAREETNGYEFVEVSWERVPGRGEAWKKEALEAINHDMEKFAQEYCCEFQGSSGTLISGAALKLLRALEPIQESTDGLRMYLPPEDNHQYIISVDVSRGKGLDYSAFQVIDVTHMPYRQVCTFKSNMITPLDYSGTTFRVAKIYKDAAVLVEINDIGGQVADSLFNDFEYENIIYTENAGTKGKRISTGFGKDKSLDRGIRTTKTVKGIGCSMLKLLVEQGQLQINDADTIYELSRFSKKANSYEAEVGAHDDLVMGLVLFSWMTDQQYFKEITNIQTLAHLRDKSDDELINDLTPFGFIDSGPNEYSYEIVDMTETPWNTEFQFF